MRLMPAAFGNTNRLYSDKIKRISQRVNRTWLTACSVLNYYLQTVGQITLLNTINYRTQLASQNSRTLESSFLFNVIWVFICYTCPISTMCVPIDHFVDRNHMISNVQTSCSFGSSHFSIICWPYCSIINIWGQACLMKNKFCFELCYCSKRMCGIWIFILSESLGPMWLRVCPERTQPNSVGLCKIISKSASCVLKSKNSEY